MKGRWFESSREQINKLFHGRHGKRKLREIVESDFDWNYLLNERKQLVIEHSGRQPGVVSLTVRRL
ncbi:MAG: hypothetical protein C4325_12340 [Blastocatellia bacterium]